MKDGAADAGWSGPNIKESITFRLDKKHIDYLRREAETRSISLNTLVCQIFTSFVEWDVNSSKAGWLIMPKQVARLLFESVPDSVLDAAAIVAAEHAVEADVTMRGSHSFDDYYSLLKHRLRHSGFEVTEHSHTVSGILRLNIRHNMGEEWSKYFQAYCRKTFNDLGVRVTTMATDYTITLEIEK